MARPKLKGFFRQYYVPNNASLVIAGKFDPKQARAWVEKYFGPLKKGDNVTRPNPAQPVMNGEMRKVYEDTVRLPRLYMVWHTVRQGDKDEAALDMLGLILSSGRGSRLQSNLVFGKQMSQDVSAFNFSREVAGIFQVTSTARPQKSLDEIEKEVLAEIERLKKEQPTIITQTMNTISATQGMRCRLR